MSFLLTDCFTVTKLVGLFFMSTFLPTSTCFLIKGSKNKTSILNSTNIQLQLKELNTLQIWIKIEVCQRCHMCYLRCHVCYLGCHVCYRIFGGDGLIFIYSSLVQEVFTRCRQRIQLGKKKNLSFLNEKKLLYFESNTRDICTTTPEKGMIYLKCGNKIKSCFTVLKIGVKSIVENN